jgi:hypothetical protein
MAQYAALAPALANALTVYFAPPFHLQIKHLLSRAPEGNVVFRVLHFTRELAQ